MQGLRLGSGFAVIAAIVVALDQWTKALTRSNIEVGEVRAFVPGVLDLTHIHNRGAAWGMFQGHATTLAIVAIVVVIALAAVVIARRRTSLVEMISFGLIVGGAIGNLIDRITQGYVTDMIRTAFIDFPVFNIADSAVTVGTAVFVVWALLLAPRDPVTEHSSEDEGSISGG